MLVANEVYTDTNRNMNGRSRNHFGFSLSWFIVGLGVVEFEPPVKRVARTEYGHYRPNNQDNNTDSDISFRSVDHWTRPEGYL